MIYCFGRLGDIMDKLSQATVLAINTVARPSSYLSSFRKILEGMWDDIPLTYGRVYVSIYSFSS